MTFEQSGLTQTQLSINTSTEGESIEQKIFRIVNNKEPIKDGAPLIYQERKEGIRPSTNIRTDRFEIAVEAADKVAKSYKARREEKAKTPITEEKKGSTQEGAAGTDGKVQGTPK